MDFMGTIKVFVILFNLLTICVNGETGTLPVNIQAFSKDNDKQMPFNTIYYPSTYPIYPQEWMQARNVPESDSKWANNVLQSLNDLSDDDEPRSRAATKFAPLTFSKPLTYEKPSYSSWPANIYQPNLIAPPPTDLLQPKFGLLNSKPNKLGSLLHLGFALLGGSGIKETLINSILRPLLASKGTLKSFIGKLSIPVLVLILVNVEILFVVWWLWEDCPEQAVETMTPFSSPATASNFSTLKSNQ